MKILVADDDRNLRNILETELSETGFEVQAAENGAQAINLLQREEDDCDVLLLDLNMPDLSGIGVLKEVKSLGLPVEVIVLTAFASVPTAVEAMKLGAYDYLTKPFNTEELIAVVEKANEKKRLRHENFILKSEIKRQRESRRIVTRSPLLLDILDNVKKVARSDFPILISGESGVGKELIARAIHEAGDRTEKAFVPINCGAIAENMLESELFGHEKGAFTGAHARKLGLLEIAHEGILFLDEICEMNPALQIKLLRAIETGRFFRVGGTREIGVDVRFVSATNKNVKEEVEKGRFRADLYYRISTIKFSIPPLRERKEDIPLLIEHFMKEHPPAKNVRFSRSALRTLSEYSWPGNVRELQNVIYLTLLLTKKDVVEAGDLPLDLVTTNRNGSYKRLVDVEEDHILNVLKAVGGQKGKAAEILGIDPKTLFRKLAAYEAKNSTG